MRSTAHVSLLTGTQDIRPYPIPNSSMLVFPTTKAPTSWSCLTTMAGKGLWKPLRMADAHVVGSFRVQMLSFRAINLPSMVDFLAPGKVSNPT